MKKVFWVVIIILVIGFGLYLFFRGPRLPQPTAEISPDRNVTNESSVNINDQSKYVKHADVIFDGTQFLPVAVNVIKGGSVTWKNESDQGIWPASNVHPTHTEYPGSGINKCGTDEANQIFDACRALTKGESYTFVFNESGSWNYHNHLQASITGVVNVK